MANGHTSTVHNVISDVRVSPFTCQRRWLVRMWESIGYSTESTTSNLLTALDITRVRDQAVLKMCNGGDRHPISARVNRPAGGEKRLQRLLYTPLLQVPELQQHSKGLQLGYKLQSDWSPTNLF